MYNNILEEIMNKKYTVFVSSTYEDLKQERQEVIQALLEMDCIPCAMELFPAAYEEQFNFIKSVIDDCDYYVLVLGGKYGSMNSDGVSYTELEFKYALERNIPIISFIHSDIDSIPNSKCEHDKNAIEKLDKFRSLAKQRLCKFWTSKEQLAGLVSRSMIQLIKRHPATGWVRANYIANEELLMKITKLYEENAELKTNIDRNIPIDTLSSGEDCIDVIFQIFNKGATEFETDNLTVSMSWNNILKQIGPRLIEEQTSFEIRQSMSKIGAQKYIGQLNNTSEIQNFKENQFIKISDNSFGVIIVQFMAMNYISVNHPNHNNDQLSQESTYTLTELGRNALIQLSAKSK